MKITSQTLENRQVELAIEVEDERVQQALQRTAKKVAGQLNVPGFRRGKAPYAVIVRSIGEDALYEEMFQDLGPQLIQEALKQELLLPFRPVDVSDLKWKPLSFKAIVSLPPVVKLGDYRSLRVPFETLAVPEEEIDQLLHALQERNTVLEPASDVPAELGLVAVLTIQAATGGEPIDFSDMVDANGNVSLLLNEERDWLPGFSANIVGLKVGEEKTFSLAMPVQSEEEPAQDQEPSEPTQPQVANFTVKLDELKKVNAPPLDDALAQTVGNYDSLDQLRASLRSSMEQRALAQAQAAYADKCIERLAKAAIIEFPLVLVEEELDRVIQEVEERLGNQKMSLDELLNIKKQTKEAYREEMKLRAITRVRQGLTLGTFIDEENLVEAEQEQGGKIVEKALDRLMAICKGEAELAAAANVAEPPAAEMPVSDLQAAAEPEAVEVKAPMSDPQTVDKDESVE